MILSHSTWREVTHYYRIMREASEACGVRYGRDVAGGFVTHDGRHPAVTTMLHAGKDLVTIDSIFDHKDKTLFSSTVMPQLRAATP